MFFSFSLFFTFNLIYYLHSNVIFFLYIEREREVKIIIFQIKKVVFFIIKTKQFEKSKVLFCFSFISYRISASLKSLSLYSTQIRSNPLIITAAATSNCCLTIFMVLFILLFLYFFLYYTSVVIVFI